MTGRIEKSRGGKKKENLNCVLKYMQLKVLWLGYYI